ncbi:hypothetical protein [Mycolicibacterium tusciae]|uniref:hypothetical protein n=1 Tax=Mycolicibacterium tusciae TaxID=75922 RepID=UPI0002DDF37F|nr:hypothetical protein [Mycolicibacterium tusciae]
MHDQPITAISKNYRRSINTQTLTCAKRRILNPVGDCWPGNRNDVVVASHTVAHPLDGHPNDPGRRPIPRNHHHHQSMPRTRGRIFRDDHYRTYRRIRARVEHVIARIKDWQILPQRRRRSNAIN